MYMLSGVITTNRDMILGVYLDADDFYLVQLPLLLEKYYIGEGSVPVNIKDMVKE